MRYGYVSLKLDTKDAKILSVVLESIGVTGIIPPEEMHMTLMYDRTNPLTESGASYLVKDDIVYSAKPVDIEILGGDSVVIVFESDMIVKRHDELKQFMTHSFEDFVPHISVKYDATENDLELVKTFKESVFAVLDRVILGKESFEPTKDFGREDEHKKEDTGT